MANLCFNQVYLIGDNDQLKKIVDAYNSIKTETKTLEQMQDILHFQCSDWGRSYDEGITRVEIIEDGTIVIECITAWSSVDHYWNTLTEQLGLDAWVSYSEIDSDIWVTNDYSKKFFKDEYVLDIYEENPFDYEFDDDRYCFESRKDFVTFMNKVTGESHHFQYYQKMINESDDDWAVLIPIERC